MIVLDTCAIIWSALEPKKLSKKAIKAINKADNDKSLIISDISIWEIAVLISKKRLEIDLASSEFIQLFLQSKNVIVQPITAKIAELSVSLDDWINNDPADRIIAATAIISNTKLVTADKNLLSFEGVDTVW